MFFTTDRIVHGESTDRHDKPEWGPLLELAPDHIDEFMWMFEVELESGLRLHAYKHIETRKYLHLDKEGRAFVYLSPDVFRADDPSSYREVDPRRILNEVLHIGRVEDAAHQLLFEIASLGCLAGVLPSRIEQMVKRWARRHEAELMANWERARNHQPLKRIEPLR